MKLVIADGYHAADFIVSAFKKRGNKLIVINPNQEYANYIAKTNQIPVFVGESHKIFVLEQANVKDADVFIALGDDDVDNYVACKLAKELFDVKKVICTVRNPKNVDIYKTLGIDSVVSSTYLLGETIKNESALEDVIQSLSLENNQIALTEIVVDEKHFVAFKKLMDIHFPRYATISVIYRKPNVIIPHGDVTILPKDKLIIASAKKDQQATIEFVRKKVK